MDHPSSSLPGCTGDKRCGTASVTKTWDDSFDSGWFYILAHSRFLKTRDDKITIAKFASCVEDLKDELKVLESGKLSSFDHPCWIMIIRSGVPRLGNRVLQWRFLSALFTIGILTCITSGIHLHKQITYSNTLAGDVQRSSKGAHFHYLYREDILALSFLQTLPRNVLFIEPFHGLGNRLRAVACAAALAKKTSRTLVIVWIPDHHLNASMSALFEMQHLTVIDFHLSHLLARVWHDIKIYDYNAKGRKDELILDSYDGPLYVRSAYVLQSRTRVSEPEISAELKLLTPSFEVNKKIEALKNVLNQSSRVVGVHIRMNTNIETDVPGIGELPRQDPAGTSSMGEVIRERSRCHYKFFIPHMKAVLLEQPETVFFLASDSYEAILALRNEFGSRLFTNTVRAFKQCEGKPRRQKICLQISLAELLFLGTHSSELIVSDWSSASELVLRVSGRQVPHKSGCVPKQDTWFG